MIVASSIRRTHVLALATVILLLTLTPAGANAGSYIVAQCAPGLFPEAPDAGYASTSSHFTPARDCNQNSNGVQVGYSLGPNETGTERGRYGMWVWQAPAGTYITGGSAYSRLATQVGIHGYLAVSPDAGAGIATENQNDDLLHLSAIPAGNWRYFISRLECTQPNDGGRCVGPGSGAHAWVKQLRLQLTDVSPPSLAIDGSMFSGALLRGPQTIAVSAADQGAGLQSVQVSVNGKGATGDDLSTSCNPLPGGLTSRLAPCPPGFAKTYTLNTADPPFVNGANAVSVCAFDYAQSGSRNTACQSRSVLVDNLCPASPVGGGVEVKAGFAGNHRDHRVRPYGRRAMIRGRVTDAQGNGVVGAQVCIEGHTALPGRPYHLIGTAPTNQNGGFSYKLRRGPSRTIQVAYRDGAAQVADGLELWMRARATLQLNRHRTRPHRRIHFIGRIPGPRADKRVVILSGTVPGAKRRFLIRRARTDGLGRFGFRYAFSPVRHRTRFVFWVTVPEQNGYPYLRGRSGHHYIRVRP